MSALRPARAALVACASILMLTLVIAPIARRDTAAAEVPAAVFDPIPGATSLGASAFGKVVTNGSGTFVEVSRTQLAGGQYAAVRVSTDGGRTWRIASLLAGEAGGATRPHVAIDGDRVAVTFIGSWCRSDAPSICPEAPYLATSSDAGVTWSSPRRLDEQAFDVFVAQGGKRTWVAWETGGTIRLRGTTDGGEQWFAQRDLTGSSTHLRASGALGALAFTRPVSVDGETRYDSVLVPMDGDAISAPVSFGDPAGPLARSTLGIAVADGRINVLVRSAPREPGTAPTQLEVRSAGRSGAIESTSLIGFDPSGASIDAGHDLVAVSVGDQGGSTVSVATSADGGRTFGPLTQVSAGTGADWTRVGVVRRPSDRPTARFSWSVPATFVDDDGDGWVDPANDRGDPAVDTDRVVAGEQQQVSLDACATSTAPSGRTIASYRWSTVADDGSLTVLPATGCSFTRPFVSGDRVKVRLDVTDDLGSSSSTVQTVAPRNLVIASLGDSVASGEGNPHEPVDPDTDAPAVWQDRSCHRSVIAGPAQAARRMEDADPHTSVTFIQLACSGAAMVDVPLVDGEDSIETGGLLDRYQGQEPAPGSVRPSQVSQLQELSGGRAIDALLVSIGANDAKFSDVVKGCIKSLPFTSCNETQIATDFEARLATLPSRYDRLAAAVDDLGIAADDVHLTEYFDPTTDELGVTQMRCAITDGLVELLDDDEAQWAKERVIGGLNAAASTAASTHGWRFVGGIAARFDRHGYCSTDPFVVRYGESKDTQGNVDGSFHPNQRGHQVYGDAIYGSIQRALSPLPSQQTVTAPIPLGDLVVLSGDDTSLHATSVRDAGGTPVALGTRRVDRVISGDGLLGAFGPPAVDPFSAVVAWTTLPFLGQTTAGDFVAPVAVRPNAAVRSVAVVQAPTGGSFLVAGRASLVYATVEANIDRPESVDVSVDVRALPLDPTDPGDPGRPILSEIRAVTLKPGLNRLLLPVDSTFDLDPGESVEARVRVDDPLGADPIDIVDNERVTAAVGAKRALETRALEVQFIAPDVEGGTPVDCDDLAGIARVQTRFARQALPVINEGVIPSLACTRFSEIGASEPDVIAYIQFLDGIARTIGVDELVAVVPEGWLQAATKGAVGASVAGARAVIIEQGSLSMTLSHEIAHSFGIKGHEPIALVDGVSVSERRYRSGIDWMVEETPPKFWTGPRIWDELAVRIGPPGGTPAPPDPLDRELDITGTVTLEGDHIPGDWTPATGAPSDLDDLEIERLLARQVDAGGNVIQEDPLGLSDVDGLWAPGSSPGGPFGYLYVGRITLAPGAVAVQVVLDGNVVEERPVAAGPEIEVTSPVAGDVAERGGTLRVAWTSSDPTLPSDILVSQDGGTVWKPLATGVSGSSADLTVPVDLIDGDAVIRVVQRTGTGLGFGDSAPFTVQGGSSGLPERVVALRVDLIDLTEPGATMPTVPGNGIITLNPDGTDVQQIVDTVAPGPGEPGFVPLRPDWSADGTRIAFDAAVSGRRDLYVVDRDGANRRRLTDASSSGGLQLICADWHPDGTKLLTLRTAGLDRDSIGTIELATVDVATGAVTPLGWTSQSYYHDITDIGCPRWTPDGGEIIAQREFPGSTPGSWDHDVYVLDVATLRSKYEYPPNKGVLELRGAYPRWINPAPSDDDRFVTSGTLFSSTYIDVSQPTETPLFIGDDVVRVDIPKIYQRAHGGYTVTPPPPIGSNDLTMGSSGITPDGTKVWATSRADLFPTQFLQTFSGGFGVTFQRISTARVGHLCTIPIVPDEDPDPPITCYAADGDGDPVPNMRDLATDPAAGPPEAPTTGVAMADWLKEITTGPSQEAVVVADPETLPADPEDPPPGDVTEPTPPGPPADGADEQPDPGSPTRPVDGSFQLISGESRVVTLPASDDGAGAFQVATRPEDPAVRVEPVGGPGDPATTGDDHRVRITVDPAFTGTVTFTVQRGGEIATITVVVVAAPRPVAVDDTVTVEAGAVVEIPAADLLANDQAAPSAASSAAGGTGLRIASIRGFDGGVAVLGRDGTIQVQADAAGTFQYVVADEAGRTDDATVQVQLEGTTTTTSTTTSTTTGPTTTTTTTSTSTTTGPSTTAAPSTSSVPSTTAVATTGAVATTAAVAPAGADAPDVDDGTLPRTGSDPAPWLSWAAGLLVVGGGLLLLSRRRAASAHRGR